MHCIYNLQTADAEADKEASDEQAVEATVTPSDDDADRAEYFYPGASNTSASHAPANVQTDV